MSQKGNWEFHFGLDIQLAAWFFQMAALIYLIGAIYCFGNAVQDNSTDLVIYGLWFSNLISAIFFFLSGYYFIYFSYPEVSNYEIKKILNSNSREMTFIEYYFTNNSLILSIWLFFFGTIPFLIYPVWSVGSGLMSALQGSLYIIAILCFLFAELDWILDLTADRFVPYIKSKRSTVAHDFCCCHSSTKQNLSPSPSSPYNLPDDELENEMESPPPPPIPSTHNDDNCCLTCFGTDIQVLSWLALIVCLFGEFLLLYIYVYPNYLNPAGYLWILSTLFFLFALIFFLLSITKDEMDTRIAWTFIVGEPQLEIGPGGSYRYSSSRRSPSFSRNTPSTDGGEGRGGGGGSGGGGRLEGLGMSDLEIHSEGEGDPLLNDDLGSRYSEITPT